MPVDYAGRTPGYARLTGAMPEASIERLAGRSSPARNTAYHFPVRTMKELLRTNDTVRLSWLQALLASAGIATVVLDRHTSIIEGSIGAIPRRLMVADEELARARALLAEADKPS
jgi:hypothetical protein